MLGQTLAHYEIESKLGEGGMGVVYLARDTKLDRIVAIKFLSGELTSDDVARERFVREAKAAAAIQHESICAIHEIGEAESGETYIVMPHYEGRTLKELIAEGPIDPMKTLSIAEQIGGGLAAAHAKGVVHRDIKPGNVLVNSKGRIKILDFGLAKLTGQLDLTQSRSSVGTVPYMAPEQLLAKTIDERTDIWALGALMYEMLTGRRAFEGAYEQAVSYAIVNTEPVPPHELVDGIPAGVENIVVKCLAKEPDKRYQSVGELLNDIDVPTAARPLASTTLSQLIHKDVKLEAGTFAGILGAVVVLFVLAFILFGRSSGFDTLKNRHLAILPFQVIGDTEDGEAFSYGLLETLTNSLTRFQSSDEDGSFWVVPSSEVNPGMSISDASRLLGANLVVQGSIQMEGERARVNMTLSDAKTMRVINSDAFDHTGASAFAIQDQAAKTLAGMLNLVTSGSAEGTTEPASRNQAANDAFLKAKGYLRTQQSVRELDVAIGLLTSAVQDDPLFASAYASLGLAYWYKYLRTEDTRWVDEAFENSQKALDLDNKLAEVYVTRATINYGIRDYETSYREFQKALEIDPENSEAYRLQSNTLRALGRTDEAKASIDKSIELTPEYWQGYYTLALYHWRLRQYDETIRAAQRGLNRAPDVLRLLNIQGAAYWELGDAVKAMEKFDRTRILDPNNTNAWGNTATAMFYSQEFDEAVEVYEEVVSRLAPNSYDFRGYLADAYYWAEGTREKAAPTYLEAIKLARVQLEVSPLDPEIYSSIANYYAHLEEPDSALTYLNRALALYIEDVPPDASFSVGEIYVTLGDIGTAKVWLEKGLSQNSGRIILENSPWLAVIREDLDFMEQMALYTN